MHRRLTPHFLQDSKPQHTPTNTRLHRFTNAYVKAVKLRGRVISIQDSSRSFGYSRSAQAVLAPDTDPSGSS